MDNLNYCTDCKGNTEVILDHTTGDSICSQCGLVLEDHFIDERSEWRTFADNDDDEDPNRVGAASDPLLTCGNLSTIVSYKTSGGGGGAKSEGMGINWRTHSLINPDRALTKGFEAIASMADGLSIVQPVKIRANEIYKNVVEQKSCKGRNLNVILAACLFIACRESKSPRTLKEICSVADRVSRKELNRTIETIKKHLEIGTGTLHASELVRRFCSHLGMKNQAMKAVQEAVENSEEIDIRRNPKSILAAIIYIVAQLSNEKIPLRGLNFSLTFTFYTEIFTN
ncbi:transcription initiation factor IIB-like [Hevea brasiliensis]|uniref:transcription initiation factor IIB-like n=1 Tax=Hevea brasiliensis TaxID=3981 RepID=UPI0025E69926|nr:transcription initiation factor IIB-like [Hevea brasiliensis]